MQFGTYYTVCPFSGRTKPLSSLSNLGLGLEINNFIIGREGFGEITFIGKTNISNIDFKNCVRFGKTFVEVYPDGGEPPVGRGLNKPAIVTIKNIFPASDKHQLGHKERLKRITINMGAKFVNYNSKTGSWTFLVKHFSKYGLNDSDEELEVVHVNNEANQKTEPKTLALQIQKQNLNEKKTQEGSEKEKVDDEKENQNLNESDDFQLENSDSELINTSMPSELMDDLENIFPTSSANASVIGLDPSRIQFMKSSLFEDDVDIDYIEDFDMQQPVGIMKPIAMQNDSSLRKPTKDTGTLPDIDFLNHYEILPTSTTQSNLQMFENTRFSKSLSHLGKLVDFEKSILFNKHGFIADSGCMMGQSFRIGWGSKMKLIYQGSRLGERSSKLTLNEFRITTVSDQPKARSNYCLNISNLESFNQEEMSNIWVNYMIKNLQAQLADKTMVEENDGPFFTTNPGVKLLHNHAELATQEAKDLSLNCPGLTDIKQIWDLCVALWGNLPSGNMEETKTYNLRDDRKAALSVWLMNASKLRLQQETRNNRYGNDEYLSSLFSLLTGHKIEEACNLAIQHGDYRLSLLLANPTSTYNRVFLEKQLENWLDTRAIEFIDKSRLKVFALLAGNLIWNLDPDISVNCCENLDWKRVLAVHLWYHCPPNASIAEAVNEFEQSFLGKSHHGKYSQPPYPAYIENDPELLMVMFDEELEAVSENQSKTYDVCYHLLKLYCDRSWRLDRLLSTQSYGASHIDYSTSWFLHQALQSLGYDHLPKLQTHQLHDSFATQLEALGLWEWSIFVLLHINDPTYRKSIVTSYLTRYVSFSDDEDYLSKESFVIENLAVPKQWVFSAKAILARSIGSYKDEAWCLMKSGQWSESHRIIIQHIAPDCIISEDFDYLRSFLSELSEASISSTILEWANGGEVCLDYIEISEAVESVLNGQVRAYDLEELQPKLVSLSKRICNLRCGSAKETLCQSEMAKKTATLLRAVLMLQKAKNNGQPSDHLLAPYFNKLPMPEDYALQELRTMTRAYRLEFSSK